MLNIGPLELMVVLLVALVIVGPQRLPEIGRTIGRALHDLRRVQNDVRDQIRFDLSEDDPPARPTRPTQRRGPPEREAGANEEDVIGEDREREAASAAAAARAASAAAAARADRSGADREPAAGSDDPAEARTTPPDVRAEGDASAGREAE